VQFKPNAIVIALPRNIFPAGHLYYIAANR